MRKSELSADKREILTKLENGKDELYNAGLNGKTFEVFPNLTANTTAEEESEMIDSNIEEFCAEHGHILDANLREALQLMAKIFIASYRDGLSARSLLKESSPEKESA